METADEQTKALRLIHQSPSKRMVTSIIKEMKSKNNIRLESGPEAEKMLNVVAMTVQSKF